MNRHRPPKNPTTAYSCSRLQEKRQRVRKDESLRDPTQSLYKAHQASCSRLSEESCYTDFWFWGWPAIQPKRQASVTMGKRRRISEYRHHVPIASKQDALQLSWHDLPRDYEGPGTSVAGKARLVGTGKREAMGIIRTSS